MTWYRSSCVHNVSGAELPRSSRVGRQNRGAEGGRAQEDQPQVGDADQEDIRGRIVGHDQSGGRASLLRAVQQGQGRHVGLRQSDESPPRIRIRHVRQRRRRGQDLRNSLPRNQRQNGREQKGPAQGAQVYGGRRGRGLLPFSMLLRGRRGCGLLPATSTTHERISTTSTSSSAEQLLRQQHELLICLLRQPAAAATTSTSKFVVVVSFVAFARIQFLSFASPSPTPTGTDQIQSVLQQQEQIRPTEQDVHVGHLLHAAGHVAKQQPQQQQQRS